MMAPMTTPIATVDAWHAALNAGDLDALLALCADDVAVGGPRGVASGKALLAEWFGRANVRMRPLRHAAGGDAVVVEQAAAWRDAETGAFGEEQVVATWFAVADGRVTRVIRFPDFAAACAAAGLQA